MFLVDLPYCYIKKLSLLESYKDISRLHATQTVALNIHIWEKAMHRLATHVNLLPRLSQAEASLTHLWQRNKSLSKISG